MLISELNGDIFKMENFQDLLKYEETSDGTKVFIQFNKSLNLSQLIVKAYIEGLSDFFIRFDVPVTLKQYREIMAIISKLPGFEVIKIDQNEVFFKDVSDHTKMEGIKNNLYEERLKNLENKIF